jgi:hypothetical protein
MIIKEMVILTTNNNNNNNNNNNPGSGGGLAESHQVIYQIRMLSLLPCT